MKLLFNALLFTAILTACSGAESDKTEMVIPSIEETTQTAPVVLSVREFKEKLSIPDVQLIDVRTDAEVADGMIEGAVQMDVSDWDSFVNSSSTLDKSIPVMVYCKAGGRSAKTAKYLSEQGYQVYDLKGGYDAWARNH